MAGFGRLLMDETGTILEVDAIFCRTMRGRAERIVGRCGSAFTAPGDREQCRQAFGLALRKRTTQVSLKRLVRFDGIHIWVQSRMTPIDAPEGVRILADMQEASPPGDWVDPADLLRLARLIVHGRQTREALFKRSLFNDHAWDILLETYIAEAEGRVLTTADVHTAVGVNVVNAARWIRALNADGLIEYEGAHTSLATAFVRLTCDAQGKVERYLSSLYRGATTLEGALAAS